MPPPLLSATGLLTVQASSLPTQPGMWYTPGSYKEVFGVRRPSLAAPSAVASLKVEPAGYWAIIARLISFDTGLSAVGMALISAAMVLQDPSAGRPFRSRHSGQDMPPTRVEGS